MNENFSGKVKVQTGFLKQNLKKVLKKVKRFVLPKNDQKITLNGKKKSFRQKVLKNFPEKLSG